MNPKDQRILFINFFVLLLMLFSSIGVSISLALDRRQLTEKFNNSVTSLETLLEKVTEMDRTINILKDELREEDDFIKSSLSDKCELTEKETHMMENILLRQYDSY